MCDDKSWIRKYVFVAVNVLNGIAFTLLANDNMYGLLFLGIGLCCHAIGYARDVAAASDTPIVPWMYALAHISVTNFIGDIPGIGIPCVRISHAVVVVGSLLVGVYLVFAYSTIVPLADAWSCYDPAFVTNLSSYDKGLCTDPSICTQPHIDCGRNTARSDAMRIAEQLLAALVIIHLGGVPEKIRYYTTIV